MSCVCSSTSQLKIEIHPKVADRFQVTVDLACARLPDIVVNDDVIWPVGIVWTKFYFDIFVWMLIAALATATEPRL